MLNKKEVLKLFKDYVEMDPNFKDNRFCQEKSYQDKKSPYTYTKENPVKYLKKIYKSLNKNEQIQFIEALKGKLIFLLNEKLSNNGN